MLSYCVVNLGCKVNRVESDDAEALFRSSGCQRESFDKADIVVVNTCTVTAEAEKKTRKTIHKIIRESKAETIVITGCSAAIKPEEYAHLDPRVMVVPKASLYIALQDLFQSDAQADLTDRDLSNRCRVGVKVQDGCNNACTYCIVHTARGESVSMDYRDIQAQVASYLRQGVPEIVLTGINLGAYSFEDYDLAKLTESLLNMIGYSEEGVPLSRIRISSVEPMDVSESLIDLLSTADDRLCKHLHLPLQAGSSKVLSEMDRPYTAEGYLHLVNRLYEAVPNLSLSTDIIVGFPGESESEFEESIALARKCRFTKMHVFPYSLREGTPAAQRRDQVPPEEKTRRAAKLRDAGEELRRSGWEERMGSTEAIVVERSGQAITDSYYTMFCNRDFKPGTLHLAELKGGAI